MANEKYEHRTMKQPIPAGSTADDLATMVKAILRLPFRVSDIHISEYGFVEWKAYVPKSDPPDGVVMEPLPADITELVSQLDLKELSGSKAALNFRSLSVVARMLMAAAKTRPDSGAVSGMAGVAWVVGSVDSFCRWMGIKPSTPPSKFFGMTLIEDSEIPKSRLMLLCARSSTSDYLEAEKGFVVAMLGKEK